MQCFTSFQIDASLLFLQKGDIVSQDTHPKKAADKWDIQRDPCTWHCTCVPWVLQCSSLLQLLLQFFVLLLLLLHFCLQATSTQCCVQKFWNTTISKGLTFKLSELHSSYSIYPEFMDLDWNALTRPVSCPYCPYCIIMQLECELILSNRINGKKPACIAEASCSFFCKSSVSSLFFATSSSHNIGHWSSWQYVGLQHIDTLDWEEDHPLYLYLSRSPACHSSKRRYDAWYL